MPPHPPELKAARKAATRGDVELLVLKYKHMTQAELKVVVDDPSTPAENILIIRVLLRGIAKGDAAILGFLTDFIFGKRPETVHVTSVNQNIQSDVTISEMVKNPEILKDLISLESKFKALQNRE